MKYVKWLQILCSVFQQLRKHIRPFKMTEYGVKDGLCKEITLTHLDFIHHVWRDEDRQYSILPQNAVTIFSFFKILEDGRFLGVYLLVT